jgi:hypothetical protein
MGCAFCNRKEPDKHSDLLAVITEPSNEEAKLDGIVTTSKITWNDKHSKRQLNALVANEVPLLGLNEHELVLHLNNLMKAAGVHQYIHCDNEMDFIDFLTDLQLKCPNLPFNNFTLTVSVAAQLYRFCLTGKAYLDEKITKEEVRLSSDDRALMFLSVLALNFEHRSL